MKTILLTISIILIFTIPVFSQSGSHYVDDRKSGHSIFADVNNEYPFKIGWLQNLPRAYTLPIGRLELSTGVGYVDDNLDVFGVKDEVSEESSTKFLDFSGNFGDMREFYIESHFGILNSVTISNFFRKRKFEYGDKEVEIEELSPRIRYAFSEETPNWPQLAIELSYNQQRGKNFVDTFSSIEIENPSELTTSDQTDDFSEYDSITINFESPRKLVFGGLYSQSTHIRFLMGKQYIRNLFTHLNLGYQWTDVESEIKFDLPQFEEFEELAVRKQKVITSGFGFDWMISQDWITGVFYEHYNIDREDKINDAPNTNSVGELYIGWKITRSVSLAMKAVYYERFLTAIHPILLNERSASVFDNPYGYIGIDIKYFGDYSPETYSRRHFVE